MRKTKIIILFLFILSLSVLWWCNQTNQTIEKKQTTKIQNHKVNKLTKTNNINSTWKLILTKNITNLSWKKQGLLWIERFFDKQKVYSGIKLSKYHWNREMKKPKLEEMSNFDYITHWFYKKRSKKIKISLDDIIMYTEDGKQDYCPEVIIYDGYTYTTNKTIKLTPEIINKIKKWIYYVIVTWEYQWNWYWYHWPLQITWNTLKFFKKHGWVILDPNWNDIDYSKSSADEPIDYNFDEERNHFIRLIWWEPKPYERYPYNTLLITSDFLLHVFHKIFDNELKYKEEAEIRKGISKISEKLFNRFKNKYLNEKNPQLKKIYAFLASYWAIESSLIPSYKKLYWENDYIEKDFSDYELKEKLNKILNEKIKSFPKDIQKVIKEEFNNILKAKEKLTDPLINYFFWNIDNNITITQDFTQFKPRSHYTTDSLLKTYFMWMKWLMREKFYFKNFELAKSALILVNNLDQNDLQDIENIQTFVKKLIWWDDDVNIFDIKKFLKENWLQTDQNIVKKFNKNLQNKLLNLKKQLIISTSYQTNNYYEKDEQQIHNDTIGFVFFGEKFTIDSYIFDKLTAGNAETQGIQKPSVTTALVIPYILNNNSIAAKLTKLWLKNYWINEIKKQWYLEEAKKLIEKVQHFDFSKNIYSKWLNLLNYIFVKQDKNLPYFEKDPLYQIRKLLTYLWSYTELKHDTLLYVKQAYAELWGGWEECKITITPPSLPVPKWYVEPNIDLINQLIKLSEETNKIMKSDNFLEFTKQLKFLKQIALAELLNKKISDEDFEKLRLINFAKLLTPKKIIWQPLQKEERWAIIADIFTSLDFWPLYEALWRPNLLLLMIKDINWSRIVIWPVYTHYEFYKNWKRLTDENWQDQYDKIKNNPKLWWLEFKTVLNTINKWK